jgi:hypothetical protein
MKKTKIKQRIENAVDAFFADVDANENNLESFRNETHLRLKEKLTDFTHQHSNLETILKQVFLFFPGTFILYILSMGFTVMFISQFFRPSGMSPRFGIGWLFTLFLAAILMTWLGLGDVRKPKHLVIPTSIISVGVVFGAIVFELMTIPHYGRIFFRDAFPFYVFPLALIVPFLAKGWIDRKNEN